MTKSTLAGVESSLRDALHGYRDQAVAVKQAHAKARDAIKADTRRSDTAKKEDLAALSKDTRAKLDAIKGEQQSYISTLRSKLENELNGGRPTDASSVLLRRDASDRTRKLEDKVEAASMLRDAIRNRDDELAHAVGALAQNRIWPDLSDEYKAAYPATAESAAALHHVESSTSNNGAFNLANSATYSMPLD